MDKYSYVYLLGSERCGTLYVGVTSNLVRRVWQHKNEVGGGFTKTYGVKKLFWYEVHGDIYEAITREKQIKEWKRAWKIRLIDSMNPHWRDLYDELGI